MNGARLAQERPKVTIRDPARPLLPPRTGEQTRRRGPLTGLVAVGAALTVAVAAVLGPGASPGTAAAALSLTERFAFQDTVGARVSSRSLLVSLDLEVRNDGRLPVVLDRAAVGEFRSVATVELRPAGSAVLQLVRTVTCPADGGEPPLDPATEGLRVRVVTAGGDRNLLLSPGVLPLGRLRTAARRACGYLPVEQAVDLTVFAAGAHSGLSVVTVVLQNASARPLELLEVRLAAGLRAVRPPRLPLPLSRTPLGGTPAFDRLDVPVVADCAASPRALDGSLVALPASPVEVVVDEAVPGGGGGARVGPLSPSAGYLTLLREAYADACS